jgi:hypothetical protein
MERSDIRGWPERLCSHPRCGGGSYDNGRDLGAHARLPALAAELVRIPVNVIVTDGTNATLAAFAATHSIPIVMGTTGGDPVALGLAKSLSRPGGNVTGTQFLAGLSEKRLQLLKQAFPGAQRVAVLANPKEAIDISEMPKAEMAAARMGVGLFRSRRARPENCVHSGLPHYQVATASSVCRVGCSGIAGRQSSTLHRGLACPPFTQSGNTPIVVPGLAGLVATSA